MNDVIGVVLPFFSLIVLGYAIGSTHLLTAEGIKGLHVFVTYVAVPALLFRSGTLLFAGSPLDLTILAVYFGGAAASYLAAVLALRSVFNAGLAEGALAGMAAAFSNNVLLGIPLIGALFGEPGILLAATVIAMNALALYGISTPLIEIGQGGHASLAKTFLGTAAALVKNPIIVGMVTGLLWGAIGLPVPGPLDTLTRLLSGAVGPCALFALGAQLTRFRLAGELRQVSVVIAFKLMLHPICVWLLATFVFNAAPLTTAVATVMAALPTGVNAYILASQYNLFMARAGAAILASTAISFATLTMVILLVQGAP